MVKVEYEIGSLKLTKPDKTKYTIYIYVEQKKWIERNQRRVSSHHIERKVSKGITKLPMNYIFEMYSKREKFTGHIFYKYSYNNLFHSYNYFYWILTKRR